MAGGVFATAGARLFIGQALAPKVSAFVEADFAQQSWVEVGWLENAGSFGDESAEVLFEPLNPNRAQKLKGVRNAGNMEATFGLDYADEGQIALRAAEATPNDYAFKLEFNDAPVGGTPSERKFIAKVMSAREQLDTANNVMRLIATLGINSNIVPKNAAEGGT